MQVSLKAAAKVVVRWPKLDEWRQQQQQHSLVHTSSVQIERMMDADERHYAPGVGVCAWNATSLKEMMVQSPHPSHHSSPYSYRDPCSHHQPRRLSMVDEENESRENVAWTHSRLLHLPFFDAFVHSPLPSVLPVPLVLVADVDPGGWPR